MPAQKYQITYKKSVDKDLRKLDKSARKIIVDKILSLASNPYPASSSKLHGASDLYRLRHADYRIIYQIKNSQLTVLVVKVGHRKDVYRKI